MAQQARGLRLRRRAAGDGQDAHDADTPVGCLGLLARLIELIKLTAIGKVRFLRLLPAAERVVDGHQLRLGAPPGNRRGGLGLRCGDARRDRGGHPRALSGGGG